MKTLSFKGAHRALALLAVLAIATQAVHADADVKEHLEKAKQDIKDAGHAVKKGAHAVGKGVKKGVRKVKSGVHKTAEKISEKTSPSK